MSFKLIKTSKKTKARSGVLKTRHGEISTPFFMSIATRGAVKSLLPSDIESLGGQIILSNTYHLWQRPGLSVLKKAKGLHKYMNWSGPILTDSGGYQVFSLSKRRKLTSKGVEFNSEVDGQRYFLTPQKAIEIQMIIGSDIMMSFDECPPYPSTRKYASDSLKLTSRWAKQGLEYFNKKSKNKAGKKQKLFGIVQGSSYKDLRLRSAKELAAMNFDGYAVGGLAVGEPVDAMYEVLEYTIPALPENKPRYLMGVGKPEQIVEAVKLGVDMFDCVIPTRHARHGLLYAWKGNKITGDFYKEIRIKQSKFSADMNPLDKYCDCYTCKNFSLSYLRHLFMTADPLAYRLATIHNLNFYLTLMRKIRKEITNGRL